MLPSSQSTIVGAVTYQMIEKGDIFIRTYGATVFENQITILCESIRSSACNDYENLRYAIQSLIFHNWINDDLSVMESFVVSGNNTLWRTMCH